MTKHTVRRGLSALAAACLAVGAAGVATTPAAYAAPTDTSMVPVELTRVVDTRDNKGVTGEMSNNRVVDVQIASTVANDANAVVPKGASAVVLNMTAVDARDNGYFVAWEAGQSRPGTSNINYMAGDTVANGATVPLSSDGKISVYSKGGADLLLDVAGYYVEGKYEAMAPSRLYDSRLTPAERVKARSITRVKVAENKGDYVALNVTVSNPAEAGYLTAWATQEPIGDDPSIGGMPQTSNLNYVAGQTIANTILVESGEGGYVSFYTMAEAALVVDRLHKVDANESGTAPNIDYTPNTDFATLMNPAQRVMDTRENIGSDKKTGYRDFNLLRLADKTKWDDVGAAIVNVTVANATADGFAAIGPDLEANGVSTSVLNFKAGQAISNRVIIPASYAGNLQAYTNVEADIILDVMGYTNASDEKAAAVLDLSKADETNSLTMTAPLVSGTSIGGSEVLAFAYANLPDLADAADPDGNGDTAADFVLDGATVELKAKWNSANSTTATFVADPYAGAGVDPTMSYLPLPKLAPDTYTISVPLKSKDTDDKDKYVYVGEFTVTDPTGAGSVAATATGDVSHSDSSVTFAEGTTFTVDGNTVTLPALSNTTVSALVTAINDDLPPEIVASGSSSNPLVFTKAGTYVAPVIGGENAATVVGAVTSAVTGARAVPTTAQTSVSFDTTYMTDAAATVSYAQPLEVILPEGFGTPDTLAVMVGDQTVTGGSVVGASDTATVKLPGRKALADANTAAPGQLPTEVTVKVSVGAAPEIEFKVNLK